MSFAGIVHEPLCWDEARSRLRKLLENYINDPPRRRSTNNEEGVSDRGKETFLSWWIRRDLDLYLGALALSVALLVLSCFSLSASLGGKGESTLRSTGTERLYRAQVAASLVLVGGSLLSLWMLRRSRFLDLNDSDNTMRRDILRFLRAIAKHEEEGRNDTTSTLDHTTGIRIKGNSLTDNFPTYRRSASSTVDDPPSWTRLPSLLLVEGDFISFQIGDVAPCHCVLLDAGRRTRVEIVAGERLSVDSFGMTASEVVEDLPCGKTTIAPGSEHLLTLCNCKSVFLVLEAPLKKFIYKSFVTSRPSQASRRVEAVRQSLSVLALFLLVSTSVILFSRASSSSADLSMLLPIPILAALGVFPVVGPFFLFFLDILGTARILVTIHPYASSMTGFTEVGGSKEMFPRTLLLIRYITATCLSRLSLWEFAEKIGRVLRRCFPGILSLANDESRPKLVRVPPASINLVENLGVATAFTLVDDELACEPHAVPQQLLIPSAKGLKLLDLCPAYEDASHIGSNSTFTRTRRRSIDSDSESEDGTLASRSSLPKKKLVRDVVRRTKYKQPRGEQDDDDSTASSSTMFEVQFEDPSWWQFLPSLKCIGLACLMLDENLSQEEEEEGSAGTPYRGSLTIPGKSIASTSEANLVRFVCHERQSKQLEMLAHCIGFSRHENVNGPKGDISAFEEKLRMHILSSSLIQEKLLLDAHERSSEMSRWWGLLRPDSTSVVVQDKRSTAYQLLTIGDPLIVVDLCHEAWQGERSTILPLSTADRQTIVETTNNWKLADLDVSAFSYSPVPRSLEQRVSLDPGRQVYLLNHHASHKDRTASAEWSFMKNQIFLGVLGSLLVPRLEIKDLLSILSDAGVRFVYFSPRNMRRQKELASQMGIDVAWNCAISLRPLESGEEDPHRMVSNYADWDVNAKLPHGVEDVRKHLEEVDNVPLLVSLFTDVTKETTKEMIEIFQDYTDTVIAVGVSHLPQNNGIFSAADIAIGIDVLTEKSPQDLAPNVTESLAVGHVLPAELDFVSSIASHACAFRFRGASSLSYIPSILKQARSALEAVVSASVFMIFGFLSFSFFILFSVCVPSTVIPFIPTLGSVLLLQVVFPTIGFTMAMSDADRGIMSLVPPKNDQSVTFARKEGWKIYTIMVLKSVLPALLPQLLHFIVFGELLIHFEPELVSLNCSGANNWVDIVRCESLKNYSGKAKIASGVIVLGQLALCAIVSSAAFVGRLEPLLESYPWKRNHAWVVSTAFSLGVTVIYLVLSVEVTAVDALPWYFYVLAAVMPFLCLIWIEVCKRSEIKLEKRAEKLRRLQFETRLGAWSPKA